DKVIGGFIDAVQSTSSGVVLSDFKSGEVLEEPEGISRRQLKQSHCVQLKLYAALYFATYGVWPAIIQIVPLHGATLEIPFTPEECSQLLRESVQKFHTINSKMSSGATLDEEAFAAPSPQNCRFCSYRPACRAYRRIRGEEKEENPWALDAFGKVW